MELSVKVNSRGINLRVQSDQYQQQIIMRIVEKIPYRRACVAAVFGKIWR